MFTISRYLCNKTIIIRFNPNRIILIIFKVYSPSTGLNLLMKLFLIEIQSKYSEKFSIC